MGRSRYLITQPDKPHFMTCTVVDWLPVFTRYVSLPEQWRYSSASNYAGFGGLIEIDSWW